MDQIHPDVSLIPILERIVADDFRYHLFENNVVPDRDTELADLTEVGSGGYASIVVAAADFTLSGVTGHLGSLAAAPISWTPSGTDWTIYGYYITDSANTLLLGVARFDGARSRC